jgi:hypothetical protein
MDITRDVIIDLLPLYIAGEASKDTAVLIEKYLEKDSELARIAKRTMLMDQKSDAPLPLSQENQLEAYQEAQTLIKQRTIIWGGMIALAVLVFLGIIGLLVFMFVSAP